MQTSEKLTFNDLPQVKDFSFAISGISVSDFNPVSFKFRSINDNLLDFNNLEILDVNNNPIEFTLTDENNHFSFNFESGFIKTNKILYAYNTKEYINIEGYKKDGKVFFKINEIPFEIETNFSFLDKIIIDTIDTNVSFDLFVNSNPINYEISVDPIYTLGGNLTGNVFSDTKLKIQNYSLNSLNSIPNLLSFSDTGLSGIFNSGNNLFVLKDADEIEFEYLNEFLIYTNTIFGEKITKLNSYRGNFYNNNSLTLNRSNSNTYSKSSLFEGYWNNSFIYSGRNKNYNLSYFIQNLNYVGDPLLIPVSVKFEPSYPLNNSNYKSEYITGYKIINSGLYSGSPPEVKFSKYYFVDGISQALNTLLFSTGCSNLIPVNYIGNSTGEASGFLTLKNIRLNNFYGQGVNVFKAAFGYTSYSDGSGYTGAPIISWGTGGNCFSIADAIGESGQFKKIHNTSAKVSSHADYLNGKILTKNIYSEEGVVTGYIISGLKITNIGSGYNKLFPPKIKFNRSSEDPLTDDASIELLYKKNGLYNFTGDWSISYNFYDSINNKINNYNGFFSGDFDAPIGEDAVNLNINLIKLDHTEPISGILTIKIGDNSNYKILQDYIYSDRYFDQNPEALE